MSSLPDETTIAAFGRGRSDSCGPSSSKACREKLRRDRLNDRPPKTDKAAVLSDAVRIVTQLRTESHNLKDSNSRLKEKNKDLKVKAEAEKERLELQLKSLSALPGSLPPPPAGITAFAPQTPSTGAKLVPLVSYPGLAMWQFMPPAAVDPSQDHALRTPVA
ncbi:hypothetical protein Droror1_Dr00020245 [Drosera rotundifolia]